MNLLDLAAERDIALSPPVRRIAEAFGDGDQALHAMEVWNRLNAPNRPLSRSAVYRAFGDLEAKGLITVSAIVGSRTFYQIDKREPLIHLVDVARFRLQTIQADDLARSIMTLVEDAGYRLAGGVDIRVVSPDRPARRKHR